MKRKRVLVAPLDWGLGHATRCIPIIRILINYNYDVFLGGSNQSLALLQNEFPSLNYVELPAYNPFYPSSGSMSWTMLIQLFKFKKTITKEHQALNVYISANNIDCIISDNRYGCWSPHTQSIFITHQTNIIMPRGLKWIEGMFNYFNRRQIKKFDQCWIPDFADHTFSGKLSKSLNLNERFIGPLSRFIKPSITTKKYDLLILLSGPEPQRTILEELIIKQLTLTPLKVLIVRGVKENSMVRITLGIEIVNFFDTEELQLVIEQSDLIISRPGYSTIMDLAKLEKKAIFIPTPGQTEQEYLALYLKEKSITYFVQQKEFDLQDALSESLKYSGFKNFDYNDEYLQLAIGSL